MPYNHKTPHELKSFGFDNQETFFGYYDQSPLNTQGRYLIFQATDHPTHQIPDPKKPVTVVIYDLHNDSVIATEKTSAYNWQQGCKLQWINETQFIFNDFNKNNDSYIAKIYDVESKSVCKNLNLPIYDVYSDTYALSLNFDRLAWLRPDYGYRNRINGNKPLLPNNENDGILSINLKTNNTELIISLDKIINLAPKESFKNAKHYFNHIMISPNGDQFIFLHRYFIGSQRFDRLFSANINGNDIKIISDHDMVSHCFWYDNNKVFAYLRDFELGDRYYLIDINSGSKKIIGGGIIDLFGDGHPHIHGDNIVFDTYPNKARMKKLFLYNLKKNELKELGEFFESFKYYGETRCDLHPRFSMDGTKVFFDSVHENKRLLYMIDLRNLL